MKEIYHRYLIAGMFAIIAFGAGYLLAFYSMGNFVINSFYQYMDYKNYSFFMSEAEMRDFFWRAVSFLKP